MGAFLGILEAFGQVAPERHARLQYDRLNQKGSVFAYVTEMKKLFQIMKNANDLPW